jgi:hypothetical protein
MGGAIPGGELHNTQTVAVIVQTHGFGINGNHGAEIQSRGQIALMQCDGHGYPLWLKNKNPPHYRGRVIVIQGESLSYSK